MHGMVWGRGEVPRERPSGALGRESESWRKAKEQLSEYNQQASPYPLNIPYH